MEASTPPNTRPRSARRRWLERLRHGGFLLPAALTGYLGLKGWLGHGLLPGWSCPLRALTGIPCPTCFLTRAVCASLQGNLSESLRWHAFGPAAAVALLVWSVVSIRSRRLVPLQLEGRHLVVISVALLLYWGVRMALHYGLGLPAFPTR
ncbi:DUF2752 domain-containing protein [Synechococcus sp. CS-1328]|nr:DUF2752 domain-containing protein [Synechococcus sp. CS-1328]